MSTPASIRLPLRLISCRATGKPITPSTYPLRTQYSANRLNPSSNWRYTSALAAPPNSYNPAAVTSSPASSSNPDSSPDVRLPRAVQAVYLRPLRREAEYGVPSCDLQMRSYSVRNLEFFTDFAMRAAYYLGLPAYGPIPLPRIVERWTVPRSSFIYKKSQENFERKTLRRLIQIKDGNPETVEIWLAFLKKHAYYGIGMKANVWNYEKIGVGKMMDVDMEKMKSVVNEKWSRLGLRKGDATAEKVMELINREEFKAASGNSAPMMELKTK